MDTFVQAYEAAIRLGFFLGIFAIMALWEVLTPRRALMVSKAVRWVNNLGLVVLNTVLLRLLFPAAAVGMAAFASGQGWGLLNHFQVPFWLSVPLAVVAMDFVIWLQHVMVHAVPALWRLHRVHHADLDYDVTTGARFHPIEIILSMLIKFATIMVLGPPVVAVILFEVILNGMAMFNHGNVRLPEALDRVLRSLLVTPRYASSAPLGGGRRGQLQFRFQLVDLGPPIRHLPGSAPKRTRGYDDRHPGLPGAPGRLLAAGHSGLALQGSHQRLRDQPPPVGGAR